MVECAQLQIVDHFPAWRKPLPPTNLPVLFRRKPNLAAIGRNNFTDGCKAPFPMLFLTHGPLAEARHQPGGLLAQSFHGNF